MYMADEIETTEEDGKKKKEKPKALSSAEIKDLINKKTGSKNAYNLMEENPTEVVGFIPSGNRLLDSNTVEGKLAGLPEGRISMLAADSGVGKSFLAIEYCKHAIDEDIDVVYYCSEPGGIEKEFLLKVLGPKRMEKFTYVEVTYMEEMFESIETLMANTTNKYLFVFDSLAACPSRVEAEGGFDASSYFAVAAKSATLGLKKIMIPLSKRGCTFLILNQVRANIGATKFDMMNPMTMYTIPGGKMVRFCCSLIMLLFASTSKAQSVVDKTETRIGKYGKAVILKSRFGTEGRSIDIGYIWGGDHPHFLNEELWFEALHERGYIVRGKITFKDGTSQNKVNEENWMELLKDPVFYKKVDALLDEAFIHNYKGDKSSINEEVIAEIDL